MGRGPGLGGLGWGAEVLRRLGAPTRWVGLEPDFEFKGVLRLELA